MGLIIRHLRTPQLHSDNPPIVLLAVGRIYDCRFVLQGDKMKEYRRAQACQLRPQYEYWPIVVWRTWIATAAVSMAARVAIFPGHACCRL